jgi:hypothetical protein
MRLRGDVRIFDNDEGRRLAWSNGLGAVDLIAVLQVIVDLLRGVQKKRFRSGIERTPWCALGNES